MKPLVEKMLDDKIIAILRNVPHDRIVAVAGTLLDNGIRCIEVTLNTPDALTQIARLAETFEGRLLLGAGTVTRQEHVRQAVQAGATYMITPYVTEEVAEAARMFQVPVIMGAMTPTEIARAIDLGADLVKVFPIGSLGPGYLKDILAPLRDAKLLAVGGVTPDNIGEYLRSGALGAGVGGSLVNNRELSEPDWENRLAERARHYVQAIEEAK